MAKIETLMVRKDGDLFIGDLYLIDDTCWPAWQTSKRLYKLEENARAAGFKGAIIRI